MTPEEILRKMTAEPDNPLWPSAYRRAILRHGERKRGFYRLIVEKIGDYSPYYWASVLFHRKNNLRVVTLQYCPIKCKHSNYKYLRIPIGLIYRKRKKAGRIVEHQAVPIDWKMLTEAYFKELPDLEMHAKNWSSHYLEMVDHDPEYYLSFDNPTHSLENRTARADELMAILNEKYINRMPHPALGMRAQDMIENLVIPYDDIESKQPEIPNFWDWFSNSENRLEMANEYWEKSIKEYPWYFIELLIALYPSEIIEEEYAFKKRADAIRYLKIKYDEWFMSSYYENVSWYNPEYHPDAKNMGRY